MAKPMKKDGQLERLGFYRPSGERLRRTILALAGMPGSGKTTFALTAPKPLALFNFDDNLEGVIEKYADDPGIQVIDIPTGAELLLKEGGEDSYREAFDVFKKAHHYAIRNFQTVVYDTATEAWELIRLALLGKLDQIPPRYYGEANRTYRQLIDDAKDAGINMILIHRLKEQYKADKATGEYILDGWKNTPYKVQTMLECWCPKDDPMGFGATVIRCTQNRGIVGDELMGDFLNFEALLDMMLEA